MYYLLASNTTWTVAEDVANQLGGHLVTINDAAEDAWLASLGWANGRSLWIGLNDAAVSNVFVWASGQPVTYTNWRPDEPNNGNGGSL